MGGHVLRIPGPAPGMGAGPRLVEDRALGRLHPLARGIGIVRAGRRTPDRPWPRARGLHRRRRARGGAARVARRRRRAVAVLLHLDRARRRDVGHPLRSLLRGAGALDRRSGAAGDHHRLHRGGIRGHGGVPRRAPAGRGVRLARYGPGIRRDGLHRRGAAHPERVPPRRGTGHDARAGSERERGPGARGRESPRVLAARRRDLPRRSRPRDADLPCAADPERPRSRRRSGGHRSIAHRPHAGRRPPRADGGGPARHYPRRLHRLLRDDGGRRSVPPRRGRCAGTRDRIRGAARSGRRHRERDAPDGHLGAARQKELRRRVGADRPHAHGGLRARSVGIGPRMGLRGLRSSDHPRDRGGSGRGRGPARGMESRRVSAYEPVESMDSGRGAVCQATDSPAAWRSA